MTKDELIEGMFASLDQEICHHKKELEHADEEDIEYLKDEIKTFETIRKIVDSYCSISEQERNEAHKWIAQHMRDGDTADDNGIKTILKALAEIQ